ncbi:DUF3768 domain-containing protein [Sulfitobacter sp. JBTF-M27]|uniref:DUF3768 domain-containing protein n=1 Tax=Sulfitobacter sediminilitoris TaxID=2698830 RepID=A0A6P0CDB8_9RHOB|nr:DUF3768 domain-containing protein [Sulfitobacter sediminilitoris]NEK24199.1 DUF3768 domain-containing protein [Sulfitobacter sediminilitoris]
MTDIREDSHKSIGEVPICAKCGSERVVTDAWACWNRYSGLWELESHFDDVHCHACEGPTKLQWIRPDDPPNNRVRALNDAFRQLGYGRGSVMITQGIRALGKDFTMEVSQAVRAFDSFTDDNDPWGEHDFGAFDIRSHKVFWKIDAYDLDLQNGSPNPANPAQTHRVLTIMLSSEY